MKPFGLITITKDQSISYEKVSRFHLDFQNRASAWKYYVKLTKDYSGYEIAIKDKETYSGNGNSRYIEEINFTQTSLGSNYTKDEIVVFESGKKVADIFTPQVIPIYQSPKKNIGLTVSQGTKSMVHDNLPNPRTNNLKSEVYIDV